MDRRMLTQLLVRPGESDRQACKKLSANKFVPEQEWARLENHEREFLRAYAVGVASRKAALVGRSAAVVHGLWTLPDRRAPVLLAIPGQKPPCRASWPDGVEYRSLRVPPEDVVVIECATPGDVLRLTNPVRTAVDIARLDGVRAGVVAMDSLFVGKTEAERGRIRAELRATVNRLVGKKGIGHARRALSLSSTKAESPYESLLRVILRERNIAVEEQMWVGRYVRPDLLWGQVAIEIDGLVKTAAPTEEEVQQVARDQLHRENWLRKQVYEVARFEPYRILRDEDGCVREILELKARSGLLGEPRVPATPFRPAHGEHWRP